MTRFNIGPLPTVILLALLMLGWYACQKESNFEMLEPAVKAPSNPVSDRGNTLLAFVSSSLDLSSFNAAILKTNQTDLLSRPNLNATLLAPTDDAFALLPPPFNNAQNINNISDPKTINSLKQILRYHIIRGARTIDQLGNGPYPTYAAAATSGSEQVFFGRAVTDQIFVNGKSEIIAVNLQTSNGTIHILNRVLFPPTMDMGQTIFYGSNFSALNAALGKTGVRYTLFSPLSNYTLFAPTDSAFAALPSPLNNAANINAISDANTLSALRSILLYHLVPGRIFSVDLREGNMPETALSGNNLTFLLIGGPKVKGNGNASGSNIVQTNLLARNGVVHVIDQVLEP
jgi:uncharacterized surface protein with fasciclin (FAS1) repeats